MNQNSELCVKVAIGSTDTLVGFPYLDGQFFDHEEDEEVVDSNMTWLVIDLADRNDTTAAQEQFLNTNSSVEEYIVR